MDNQDLSSRKPLSEEELGITLELANITSGAASSTLSMLIDQDLQLGQPEISEFTNVQEFLTKGSPAKSVLAVTRFQNAAQVPVGYLLDIPSAITIANIMMGGMESAAADEISDIQLSAVGEAISQMTGAAANSISQSLSHQVDVTAPEVAVFSIEKLLEMMPEVSSDGIVMVRYKLSGSTLIPNCELLQITPTQGARHQIDMVRAIMPNQTPDYMTADSGSEQSVSAMAEGAAPGFSEEAEFAGVGASAAMAVSGGNPADAGAAFQGDTGGTVPGGVRQTSANPVMVQPVEFPSFDNHIPAYGGMNKNLELVMDVCLNLTVELGRTELPIKEVLELTRGSVIELNRVAGESVDLFANGKMIAKGEVVVIEDNFGLRITSIVSPADRLRGL